MCWVRFWFVHSIPWQKCMCALYAQAVRSSCRRNWLNPWLVIQLQYLVEETKRGSQAGLLGKLFPRQRTDDVTSLFLYCTFEPTCAFLDCSAGVLHDPVSETQSQRETREETRKQSERASSASLRTTRLEDYFAISFWSCHFLLAVWSQYFFKIHGKYRFFCCLYWCFYWWKESIHFDFIIWLTWASFQSLRRQRARQTPFIQCC